MRPRSPRRQAFAGGFGLSGELTSPAPLPDPDRLLDILIRANQPDMIMQVSPAFADLPPLGFDDPSAEADAALRKLAAAVGPSAEVVSVEAGSSIAPGELDGLSISGKVEALKAKRRRQMIGIYTTGAAQAIPSFREKAVALLDLGASDRLGLVNGAPFAMHVPDDGVEAAIRALYEPSGFRASLDFQPCPCGPILIGDIRVERLEISFGGGGGSGAPPEEPSTGGVPTKTVSSSLSCTIAGVDLAFAFDVHLDEALEIRRVQEVRKLDVKAAPRVDVTRLTSADVPDLANKLHEGNLGQRLLSALLRPAVAFSRGVQDAIGNGIENIAPRDIGAVFSELADALSDDIPLASPPPPHPPAPPPPAKKLQFDFSEEVVVGDDAVDLGGFVLIADRQPAALTKGRATKSSNQTLVTMTAFTRDFRNPTFTWTTSATGAQIIAPANVSTVHVSYPSGTPLLLRLDIRDDDRLSLTLDGELRDFFGTVLLVPSVV